MAVLLLTGLLSACAGVAGSAIPGTTTGSVTTLGTSTTPSTSKGAPTTRRSTPASTEPSKTAAGPPFCTDDPGRAPATPTGKPLITVTHGANSWIANPQVEPLAVAVYPDRTTIRSEGIGERAKPMPQMRIGMLPSCRLEWVESEIRTLSTLDMGEAGITDQGTTKVTYTPATGAPVVISVYALGIGDRYVMTGQENRARLTAVIAVLHETLGAEKPWTPDRLKVTAGPLPVTTDDEPLVWPPAQPLEKVLAGKQYSGRCGVVSGADVQPVLSTLGAGPVASLWSNTGTTYALQLGALVPGQVACGS